MSHILVADDDAAMREIVVRTLTAAGHSVITASDGQEALDAVTAAPQSFALLIADVDMPLVDGIDLAGRVGKLAPDVKVILMSGHAEGQVRASALSGRHAVVYLAKPFTMDVLRSAVRAALG